MALAGSHFSKSERGFSLIEVIVATGLMAVALVAVSQLFAIAIGSNSSARDKTFATVLAEQKLEQLRGLTWGFDVSGVPMSDTTTDIAVDPPTPNGGPGLSPSPATSLRENTPGYVDYVDRFGRVTGGNTLQPPAGSVYFRRWSVEPLPTNPNNTLILQVVVGRLGQDRTAADQGNVARMVDDARVITVKTRKAQ